MSLECLGGGASHVLRELATLELDRDAAESAKPVTCAALGIIVYSCGSLVTLIDSKASGEDVVIAELEFDQSIIVMCFEPTGSLVVLGDSAGSIHFVTTQGLLVYSKRVIQGSTQSMPLLLTR